MKLLFAFLLTTSILFGQDEIFIEAEDTELFNLSVETTKAGYSGAGYVAGSTGAGDSLRFQVTAEEGVYAFEMSVSPLTRINSYSVWIDGVRNRGSVIGSGSTFSERSLFEYRLSGGTHTIVVQIAADVDFIRLSPVTYDPPTVPEIELSDVNATPSAKALMYFLKANYGKYILSGQQTLNDIGYITHITGREPAIGSFDLIDYSPSRVERQSSPSGASESWIQWADDDGIVNLMWHWNAPTGIVDVDPQTGNPGWWQAFYPRNTTFDFAAALEDTLSEGYDLLLRDIDAIADQLWKFQEADIPVIWRPLHEAAGGWFWWGASGAQPFIQLWRLMYTRLVHLHGLHNLIWVYTHEPNADIWYPGDEYVDIVSIDVYADEQAAIMRGEWTELRDLFGDRYIIALSESGTLPDPEVISDFGVWWSWFSIWYGGFIRDIDPDYLTSVYNSDVVMTRDELPAWRTFTSVAETESERPAPTLALYPNPSTGPVKMRLALPEDASIKYAVFDLLGRRIQSQELGFHSAGIIERELQLRVASGMYFLRVWVGNQVVNGRVVVVK